MAKRVCICLSHAIEEYDQLKLLSGLGYEVVSIGGYIDPRNPHTPMRPPLDIPFYSEVKEAVDELNTSDNLGAAQARIPERVLEWLGPGGVLIFHHYLDRLYGQWAHLEEWRRTGGRIIWRTVGQSVEHNERQAQPYFADGLEIVRYSPKERNIPGYAGEDALIRFYKDPDEWCGWTGTAECVTNVTQRLLERGQWCNAAWYLEATRGLTARPMGPGSEQLPGGVGEVTTEQMRDGLRTARCYVYTGTQPASLTLGLLEALMTGIPVVSIGPSWMTIFPYGPELFEGHELAPLSYREPGRAREALEVLLRDPTAAARISQHQRHRAVLEFGIDTVGPQWLTYLGAP